MKAIRCTIPQSLLCLLLFVPFLRAQSSPPFEFNALHIIAQECDAHSDGFTAYSSAHPQGVMPFANCLTLQAMQPVTTQRYIVSPRGNILLDFTLLMDDSNMPAMGINNGRQMHTIYKITAKATGPAGEVATNTGTTELWGSAASDAPSGGMISGVQAGPGGVATTKLQIPLNVDWAESVISYSIQVSQGIGNTTTPATETCTTASQINGGQVMCSNPDWTLQTTVTGPALPANTSLTLPSPLTSDQYVLLVVPAAAFQLAVVPVAIVYAPLGNGSQAKSTFQLTSSTGSTLQVGNTNTTTTTWAEDDKTSYDVQLGSNKLFPIPDTPLVGGAVWDVQGSWDHTVENDHQSSYGMTGSLVNADQILQSFQVPAEKTPLDQVAYGTQPYWNDLFLATINAQFTAWDYPGGPIISPLGSATTLEIPLGQLVNCLNTPTAAQTASPNTTNQSHFLEYASSPSQGTTVWVWLSSSDCSNVLSLDQFYVKGTQSATPMGWRQLYGGNASTSNPTTVTNTQSTQFSEGTTATQTGTTKVTAVEASSFSATGNADPFLAKLGITQSTTITTSKSTALQYTAANAATIGSQTQVSTVVQDTSGKSAPINVLQDLLFQGIAVQDTDMHYSKNTQKYPIYNGPIIFKGTWAGQKLGGVPVYGWHGPLPKTPPAQYVSSTPYGNFIVTSPSAAQITETLDSLKSVQAEATKKHVTRPVPPPGPAVTVTVSRAEALTALQNLKSNNSAVVKMIQKLQNPVALKH